MAAERSHPAGQRQRSMLRFQVEQSIGLNRSCAQSLDNHMPFGPLNPKIRHWRRRLQRVWSLWDTRPGSCMRRLCSTWTWCRSRWRSSRSSGRRSLRLTSDGGDSGVGRHSRHGHKSITGVDAGAATAPGCRRGHSSQQMPSDQRRRRDWQQLRG